MTVAGRMSIVPAAEDLITNFQETSPRLLQAAFSQTMLTSISMCSESVARAVVRNLSFKTQTVALKS